MQMTRRLCREKYTVGWVCALSVELTAALAMLDEEDETPQYDPCDTNIYTCGRVGKHNVVIACLPKGITGTTSAAAVALQMKSTFASIRFGLMVGIGGGVPSKGADIRLGDVVVSEPYMEHGGVIQYDFGKAIPSGFKRTGFLNMPPTILLAAVSKLDAKHKGGKGKLMELVSKLDSLQGFGREAAGSDTLFEASYEHPTGATTCNQCSTDYIVNREVRTQEVAVHYGTIASGNLVMRNATVRDKVSAELGGVLCFEMEAAGLMNSFPCLVIRGICDYADSHKNKRWQTYAAGTAAAYANELLSVIPPKEVPEAQTVEKVIQEKAGIQKKTQGPSEKSATAPSPNTQSSSLNQNERNAPRFGCQTCPRKFDLKEAAHQHMDVKDHWFQAKNQHMHVENQLPRNKCQTCKKEFKSAQAANQHMANEKHWGPNISCERCTKTFHTLSGAYDHLNASRHQTLIMSCKMCSRKFKTEEAANQHARDTSHLVIQR